MDADKSLTCLAKKYVLSSNLHLVDECIQQMTLDAEYCSNTVGSFKGVQDVRNMMTTFFDKFPTVHWQVSEYVMFSDDCVQFDFVRTGCSNAEGKPIVANGREFLHFTTNGSDPIPRICKIEVETTSVNVLD